MRGVSPKVAAMATLIVAFVAFTGGWALGGHKSALTPLLPAFIGGALSTDDQPPAGVDFAPVWKSWNVLNTQFVPAALGTTSAATTTPEDMVWGMIEGMASSLGDPYTVFMPPVKAQQFHDDISGSFQGVGMEVDSVKGALIVVSPLKDSPAAKAGILAKDIILKIDGESTANMDVATAVKKIRGPQGSKVKLSILHDGSTTPKDIDVTRDVINFPTLETKKLPGGIFVISLYTFTATSPALFRDAIRAFVVSGDKKLIFDLRGNPGGYLDAAVEMASYFLPSGEAVVTEDYGTKQDPIVHRSLGYDVVGTDVKTVILVDKGSASASEILSGALHSYGRATMIGTNTFGKGSVQELISITPDTSLKVTVARWLLPGNIWIPHTGIVPDIMATTTEAAIAAHKDEQMDRAVQFLTTGK